MIDVVIHAKLIEILHFVDVLDQDLFVTLTKLDFFLQGIKPLWIYLIGHLTDKSVHLMKVLNKIFIKQALSIVIFKACSTKQSSRLIINNFISAAAATCTSRELFNFENLFSFWCTFDSWVVDFIEATFIAHDFLHLFFRDEPAMVAISVLGQVLSAVVSYMVLVHSLFFLFPVAHHLLLPLLQGHR